MLISFSFMMLVLGAIAGGPRFGERMIGFLGVGLFVFAVFVSMFG